MIADHIKKTFDVNHLKAIQAWVNTINEMDKDQITKEQLYKRLEDKLGVYANGESLSLPTGYQERTQNSGKQIPPVQPEISHQENHER